LFIGFYFSTYKKSPKAVMAKKAAARASKPRAKSTSEKMADIIKTAKETILESATDEKSACVMRI
jgi:hypothetical protein